LQRDLPLITAFTTLTGIRASWYRLSVEEILTSRRGNNHMATETVALAAGVEGGPLADSDAQQQSPQSQIINDFSIQIATVNGSGSQSANSVLLKSIFRMGIPVSGKNLFPSNIAGLPTWYTIRASRHGYVARKKEIDILIAMNPDTSQEDMLSLPAGAAAIYEETANLQQFRSDVACYPVPFDKLTAAVCPEAKLRKLVKNMIYVGVAAQLLKMDMAAVEPALRKQFAKKVKAADWSR
jgi:2-oxoglutarate ferredoxin oxidoreductase subunit alpha